MSETTWSEREFPPGHSHTVKMFCEICDQAAEIRRLTQDLAEANLRAESLRGEVARLNEELELVAEHGTESYDALAVANARIEEALHVSGHDMNDPNCAACEMFAILSRDTPEGNNG